MKVQKSQFNSTKKELLKMVKIKVLIVDDSALMRRTLKQILLTDSTIEVVGTSRDGEDAIIKAKEFMPNVVTMDINMPLMDGITSMQHILEDNPNIGVLIVSSLSTEGAMVTFEALELGAFDYVAKPSGTVSSDIHLIGREIIEKVKAAYKYSRKKSYDKETFKKRQQVNNKRKKKTKQVKDIVPTISKLTKIVVIGISTGGPNTLMEVLPEIKADIKAAILIVQHMPPAFTGTFSARLNNVCQFEIKEAESGDKLEDGRGYLAPGGYQLVLRKNIIRVTSNPQTLFMPSVDVTMDSVISEYNANDIIGVLMTGMGNDGADSMVRIKEAGGWTIAEDESTAIVYGMPREAIERGGASIVVPSHKIANEIVRAVNR